MEEAGQRLRRVRERLKLRYRDVEEASQRIARSRGNNEFLVGLSRLADIENRGTVPSFYRLYSLCAIYRLDFVSTMQWYGVDLTQLVDDAGRISIGQTHPVDFKSLAPGSVDFPIEVDEQVDLKQTSYFSRHIHRWGKLPVAMLESLDIRRQRYGFVGTNDWSMYPILAPGSFVQIDESKHRVVNEGWTHEYDRPIYFLEHRTGFRCCWCTVRDGLIIVQPHSASHVQPEVFKYPGELDVVGQVVAVAMRLDLGKRRHTRS
jgi:transcriptional regulator with XRE-family HTH domain